MRRLRYFVCGAALLASVGASSASAVMWNPSGSELTATQVGDGDMTTNTGAQVTCQGADAKIAVTAGQPDLATTTHGIANPVTFTNCTAVGLPASVTTFGTWEFTATSTTVVDASATPLAGDSRVATIHVPVLGCDISVNGPISIPNNTWNNGTAQLAVNNAQTFTIVGGPTESCVTTLGTTGTLRTTFSVPGASIT